MKLFHSDMSRRRNWAANGYAIFIYALIIIKIILLQKVNVSESCDFESVARCIQYSLYNVYISAPFFALFLIIKNATWKTVFSMLSFCPFILTAVSLKASVCCHESYADSPEILYFLLILASLTIFIIRCNHYKLLLAAYLIAVLAFNTLMKLLIYSLIFMGIIES